MREQEEGYDLEPHTNESQPNSSMLIYHHKTQAHQTAVPQSSALTITLPDTAYLHALHCLMKGEGLVILAATFRQPVTVCCV